MRALTVAALKGGSGKTITAHALAACFAERGRRVLLVDLDAQATLSGWLDLDESGPGVVDVMRGEVALIDAAQSTPIERVEAIPPGAALAAADRDLWSEPGAEGALRAAVRAAPGRRWDVLVLDTPPGLHLPTLAAIVAAPEVVAVLAPDAAGVQGLVELRETVDRLRERIEPRAHLRHLLPCNVPRTRLARDVVDALRQRFDRELLDPIRQSARVPEALAHGVDLLDHDPDGRATADYRAAAAAILKRSPRRKANR